MSIVTDNVFAKIAAFVAAGKPDCLRDYLRFVIGRGGELAPVRAGIDERATPAFAAMARAVAPWLENDALETLSGGLAARIRALLAEAGQAGMSTSLLRLAATSNAGSGFRETLARLEADGVVIAESSVQTGGRPATLYRLAEHAVGVMGSNIMNDPFAFTIDPKYRIYE